MIFEKEFQSEGSILRGNWYSAADPMSAPCIIMCHGTSATIAMALVEYALEFQKKGFNVFIYDHLGFGISDGSTRLEISPWVQGKGLSDAVSFVKKERNLHNGQIIIWGDSYAGMLVLVTGSLVEGIVGLVSFTAACGPKLLKIKNPDQSFKKLKEIFSKGKFDQMEDWSREGPMPVVSSDQKSNPSLLTPLEAYNWFIAEGGKPESGWKNTVTRIIPKTEVPFSPFITAPFLTVPVLMMVAKEDEMPGISKEVQVVIYDSINSKKEFYEIAGGHFGALYPGTPAFYDAIEKQSEFIKSIL